MIRVIHYSWSMDFGGIERLILDLSLQQQMNPELQVSVLAGKGGGRMLEKLTASGIEYKVAGLKKGSDFSMGKYSELKKIFEKVDIIHLHTFTPLVCAAAYFSGKKLAFTEHGNFGFGREATASDHVIRFLLKIFLNRFVDFISFNSCFTRDEAYRRYGLRKVKQQVIYNGTRLDKTDVDENFNGRKQLSGKFVAGTSSRLAGFKRIDRLVQAFAKFAAGKSDVLLLIVGEGPLRKELEQLVADLGIGEKTIFTGYSAQAREWQATMDVCVFPSHYEPFGIAALETLALGKPTLAMEDGGGLLEIISAVSPGDIVKDEDQLALRLEYYYSRPPGEPEMRMKRMEYVQKFDIANMQEEFFTVYKKLAG